MKPSQKLEIRSPCRFPGTWSERSGDFQTRHGRHHFRGPRRSFPGLRWASCGVGYLYRLSLHCCGLMVSSPGPCASSGGRLPEALFMVSRLDSKGAKKYGLRLCVDSWSIIYVPTAIIETGHLLAANCPQTSRMKALKLFVQSAPLFFLSNRLLKIQPISIKF